MKIKATSPCYKFINATPEAQIDKIREEVEEVAEAWAAFENDKNKKNLQALLVELLDVKACVNTALAQIEQTAYKYDAEIVKAQPQNMSEDEYFSPNGVGKLLQFFATCPSAKRAVIVKNMRRGYYLKPEEGSGNHE